METSGMMAYKEELRKRLYKKLYERLLPLLTKINKEFVGSTENSRFDQVIDFVAKAVEERIDRMSQTEGDKS